jgi:hypothetical protein
MKTTLRPRPNLKRSSGDRLRRSRGAILSRQVLRRQNRTWAGTGGVSRNNGAAGFVPAYRDTLSGDAVVSRFADGTPAPLHLLDGLPDAWVLARDGAGRVIRVRPGVIAGFLRDGRFYTREEAARALLPG